MSYVFIGTGTFAAAVLSNLPKNPTVVITAPDRVGGRGMKDTIPSAVKIVAQQKKIPYIEKDRIIQLSKYQNMPIVLSDFGQIIPKKVLRQAKYGIWNIHPSLLPKYRGPTPIQTAILNGDKKTGVTIIQLDSRVDHGPILAQEKEMMAENDTFEALRDKLAVLGAKLVTSLLVNPENIRPDKQKHSRATFTKLFTKQDGCIPIEQLDYVLRPVFSKYNLTHVLPKSFVKIDNSKIDNLVRALHPWPGVWTKTSEGEVIKITPTVVKFRGKEYSIASGVV